MDHRIDPRGLALVCFAGIAVGLAAPGATAHPTPDADHRGGLTEADSGPILESRHTSMNLRRTGAPVGGFVKNGRLSRLYGGAMAQGATAQASVQQFLDNELELLGVPPADMVPSDRNGLGNEQPVMYLPETDSYKFTAFYYDQVRDGVPVFRSRLTLLVRNQAGFPLVLANTDVRDLGGFQPAQAGIGGGGVPAEMPPNMQQAVRDRFQQLAQAGVDEPSIEQTRRVIYAEGLENGAQPVLADETIVRNEVDEWLIVTDAATGAILLEEHRIHFADVSGNVSGLATEGFATAECNDEVSRPIPYLQVDGGGSSTFTDVNGDYFISDPDGPVIVSATLDGEWFTVFDFQTSVTSESAPADPPSLVDLIFNAANNEEFVRAQVNAYIESNIVRDTVVAANPAYPTINDGGFPVWTNRTDGFCPSNAWYDPGLVSINFCSSSGGSNPNTAWSSVIHHEFGHHLVQAGGSGQGMYGEGMGDVMSAIILDTWRLGAGWGGDCNNELRSADNTIQYPCDGSGHFCGQLISGCVWDTRNELVLTEPANYQAILGSLAVNAILVHTGSDISPDITIDWLTLDDDDADINNGTPHYNEIAIGFGNHNMPAPPVLSIGFNFPSGTPTEISPNGDTTIPVEVVAISGTPDPGTAEMVFDDGGGPVVIPLSQNTPNNYTATFPATTCGDAVSYYFRADDTGGFTQVWPSGAPAEQFNAVAALGSTDAFVDDFESDLGWSVTAFASTGNWDRGVPVGGGDRGDPPTDADGSGQCYLTQNTDGDSDVDGGTTTLESPVLDASDANSYVEYWRWYSNTFGGSPNADIMVVEVSDDGGSSWALLETVGPSGIETDGEWFQKQFRVSDFVANTANFRVRFSASDLGDGSVVEAGVDGVRIIVLECDDTTPCEGDVDGSGQTDTVDLLALLAAWGSCPGCPEDLDGDGNVNTVDLLAMLAAWGPCP